VPATLAGIPPWELTQGTSGIGACDTEFLHPIPQGVGMEAENLGGRRAGSGDDGETQRANQLAKSEKRHFSSRILALLANSLVWRAGVIRWKNA
jgi:hypothetical protein